MSSPDRKLVLIVDDSPTNVAVVSGMLKDLFRTKIATDGEKALAVATSAEKPDLILLDVVMPDMDGFEVCRRLKANLDTREIPIIFLTAKTDAVDEVKGFEVGAVDYIHKPFSAPIVLARVKTQLALQAALVQAREASVEKSFMSSEALTRVLASLRPINLQSGDVLIHQGEASDAAFFLDSGSMLVCAETRYGPVTLATLQAPRLIGEIGALAGLARTTSVKALAPARVFRISRSQLFELRPCTHKGISRYGGVRITPKSGRAASPRKESAKCQKQTLHMKGRRSRISEFQCAIRSPSIASLPQ
jgi:CheY-like chemotaxis protein